MKSFAKLVKNELIKIFAQMAYRVLFFIMIALFILIPLISKGLDWIVNFGKEQNLLEERILGYEEVLEDTTDPVQKEYYKIQLNALKYYEDNGLSNTSWQYTTMYNDYVDFCMTEYIYGQLKNGTLDVDDFQNTGFSQYINISEDFPSAEYEMMYNESVEQRKQYEQLIANSDITDFYQKNYDELSQIIVDYKVIRGQLMAEKIQNNNDESMKYQIIILNNAIDACEISKSIFKVAIEEKSEFESWQYNSALASYKIAYEISTASLPHTEEEFSTESVSYETFENYDEYIDDWNDSLEQKLDALKVLKFSIENDVPTQSMQNSSAKGVFLTTVTSNISFIIYFAIVLSALIVANEFSSGSARLLFIRPHKRNKILISKYVAVIILVTALNVVNIILSFLFTVMFNGVGDIFASELIITGGVVKKSWMIWQLLKTVILSNFRLVFLVTFTFMLSTLFKKGALGIVSGIVVDVILTAISNITLYATDKDAVKFTPFPYYTSEMFATSKTEGLLLGYSDSVTVSNIVNIQYYSLSNEFSVWGAIGNFVFWVAACFAVTLFVFRKQEIKN